MEESHTTIVAFKANGLGVLIADGQTTLSPLEVVTSLDNNKTVPLTPRVHFATSGSTTCRLNLARALSSEEIQAFGSGLQAAEFVRNYINEKFLDRWGNRSLSIVLVANIDGPRIFTIGKVPAEGNYHMVEVNEHVIARGKGAHKIFPFIDAFRQNMNAKDSFNYAYKCIRMATLLDSSTGGDITMIRIYPHNSHTTVFYQEDPTNCTRPYCKRSDYNGIAPDGDGDGFLVAINLASYPDMIDFDQDQQVPGQNHP